MSLVHTPEANGHMAGVQIDHQAILRTLKLNPADPNTQALLLVCDRYGLDPLLKHMVLIQGTPYVTRDGLLSVAHRSGQLDGIEVVDQGVDSTHYWAKVAVYRKDMGRPFTYIGRFPKAKPMAKEFGPEMAVKCAEVMALRRAFSVTGISAAEERWDVDSHDTTPAAIGAGTSDPFDGELPPRPPLATTEQRQQLQGELDGLDGDAKKRVAAAWKDAGLPPLAAAERFNAEHFEAALRLVEQVSEPAS